MKQKINLKEMEKKAFLDSNQDGFMEIIMGVFLFAIAGYIGTKNFPILLIFLLIFGPIWMQIFRNKYTYPRIGYAKPSKKMAREIVYGVFLYMFVVLFMIFVFPFTGNVWDLSSWYQSSLAFFGIMTIGVFIYIGFKLRSIRNYILAVLSLAGVIVASVLDFGTIEQSLEMYFLGMSGILIITGIVLFLLFLKKYPLSKVEITNDN